MLFSKMGGWALRRNRRSTRRSPRLRSVELLESRMPLTGGLPDFSSPSQIEMEGRPDSVAVADFNGDGNLDLASAIRHGIGVALGNGDGTFQQAEAFFTARILPESFSIATADLNKDGKPDLVVTHYLEDDSISVLLNHSSVDGLVFTPLPRVYMGEQAPVFVVLGDLNNDGNLDVVTANIGAYSEGVDLTESIGIRLGNGDGTFQDELLFAAAGNNPNSLAIGDLNGDQFLDLAVTYSASSGPSENSVGVLLGNGDGTLKPVEFFAVGATPSSVTMGDFDRDGDLDLAVSNYDSHNLTVLLNDGFAEFRTKGKGTYKVGLNPEFVVNADFNGDGKLDLAVVNAGSESVTVLVGNGNGRFHPGNWKKVTFPVGGFPNVRRMAVADFDEDGRPDLAVPILHGESGAVSVLLNQTHDRERPGLGRGRRSGHHS